MGGKNRKTGILGQKQDHQEASSELVPVIQKSVSAGVSDRYVFSDSKGGKYLISQLQSPKKHAKKFLYKVVWSQNLFIVDARDGRAWLISVLAHFRCRLRFMVRGLYCAP